MIHWLWIRLFSKATNYQQIKETFLFTVDFVLSSVNTLHSHLPAKGNLHSEEERATHHKSLKVCNLSNLTTIGWSTVWLFTHTRTHHVIYVPAIFSHIWVKDITSQYVQIKYTTPMPMVNMVTYRLLPSMLEKGMYTHLLQQIRNCNPWIIITYNNISKYYY